MKLQDQKGFAAIETILILVILVVVAGTGYFVWHSKQQTDATLNAATKAAQSTPKKTAKTAASNKTACTTADKSVEGALYTNTGKNYSLCIPDGWKVYADEDTTTPSGSLIAIAQDMVYKPGTAPTFGVTGGKDGAFAFSVFYNTYGSSIEPHSDYNSSSFSASNIKGTVYSRVETSDNNDGIGGVPKGTKTVIYHFVKGKATLDLEYNLFPGDPDQQATISKIAQTITFN